MTEQAVPYFLAEPATPNGRGVVLCCDGQGLGQFDIRLAQRFAKEGYWAAAPDVYFRFGGSNAEKATAGSWHRKIDWSAAARDVAACAAVLRARGASSIAVLGFCLGGSIAYATGLEDAKGIDAVVSFYGVSVASMAPMTSKPLLALIGGRDEHINAEMLATVRDRHPDDVVIYPEARHGFMKDDRPEYDPDAASDAWSRVLSFLSGT
jgi:carboxymethylenebutenolidase